MQHLVISQCGLSQVMLGRICMGAKCSKSLLALHLDGNPGISTQLKMYLCGTMKASIPSVEDRPHHEHKQVEHTAFETAFLKEIAQNRKPITGPGE
jgi:hypothetical protein